MSKMSQIAYERELAGLSPRFDDSSPTATDRVVNVLGFIAAGLVGSILTLAIFGTDRHIVSDPTYSLQVVDSSGDSWIVDHGLSYEDCLQFAPFSHAKNCIRE